MGQRDNETPSGAEADVARATGELDTALVALDTTSDFAVTLTELAAKQAEVTELVGRLTKVVRGYLVRCRCE